MRTCNVEGCNEKHYGKGYCQRHYNQKYKNRPFTDKKQIPERCTLEGCNNPHRSLGYCDKHYMQFYRGHPFTPNKEKDRHCSIEGCNNKHYGKGFCAYHYNLTEERVEGLRKIRAKYIKSEKGKIVVSRKDAKRRALKVNTTIENFSPIEIFERDNYICCVCGLPIDPSLRRPNKLSVSLEHFIPLSKGGNHSRENCSASHIICNMRKGAKLISGNFEGASI